jgi:hypothetical protein
LQNIFPHRIAIQFQVYEYDVIKHMAKSRCRNCTKNLIQEEIKRRLNSGNTYYHSVQNLLSSHLLSKNIQIRIYKSIILPVVLYGCETWSLIFKNRVLRRIFGPNRDEMKGGWRKLHNEELHNLYSSPSIIRMIKSNRVRWAGHVAEMEKDDCI